MPRAVNSVSFSRDVPDAAKDRMRAAGPWLGKFAGRAISPCKRRSLRDGADCSIDLPVIVRISVELFTRISALALMPKTSFFAKAILATCHSSISGANDVSSEPTILSWRLCNSASSKVWLIAWPAGSRTRKVQTEACRDVNSPNSTNNFRQGIQLIGKESGGLIKLSNQSLSRVIARRPGR